MDNSISNISSSNNGPHSYSNAQNVDNQDSPPKRRPGRPKGSTKKNLETIPTTPKVKRPVGRPRKDGYPAGSVGPRSTSRSVKTPQVQTPIPFGGDFYRQVDDSEHWPTQFPPPPPVAYSSVSVTTNTNNPNNLSSASGSGAGSTLQSFQIDPNLDRDDWSDLAHSKPNTFLATLLTALAAPNPVSSAGPSVEQAFKSHLVSLAPNPSQMQPIPSLYSILKTFWLPSSPSYFSLTASASTARTPSEHRFLYWDPQPLVFNGIACPSCSAPLNNKGSINTGPIKIYDIEKPFFIIGCEYVCKSVQCVTANSPEGRKFSSTDSSILRSLPIKLKDEFPARLMYSDADAGSGANIWNWKALGVSLSLWNMIMGCLAAGLKKEAILGLIKAIQFGVGGSSASPAVGAAALLKDEQMMDADHHSMRVGAGMLHEHHHVAGVGAGAGGHNGALSPSSPEPDAEDHHHHHHHTSEINTMTDAYNDAWRANSAVTDVAVASSVSTQQHQQHQQQSSNNASTTSSSAATYDFTKSLAFSPYGYNAYSFLSPNANVSPTNVPTRSSDGGPSPGPSSLGKRTFPFGTDAGDLEPPSNPNPVPSSVTGGGGVSGTNGPTTTSSSSTHVNKSAHVHANAGSVNGGSVGGAHETQQKRSPRHCCKCGSQDCKGKGGRSFCMNGCQDCGKFDCKGRNSRRPDKRCSEGWS